MSEINIEIFTCDKCGRTIKAIPPIVCPCSISNSVIIHNIGPSGTTSQPNMIQKAQNFGKAIVKHAQNKFISVSNNIKEERLSICKNCEFYNQTNPDNPTCNKCGCFLKIKTGWASEKCPINKWLDIKTQSGGGCGCNKK
jgi:hypothetical protein